MSEESRTPRTDEFVANMRAYGIDVPIPVIMELTQREHELQSAAESLAAANLQISNQAAQITGHHKYVGQDFKFRLDCAVVRAENAEAALEAANRERDKWKERYEMQQRDNARLVGAAAEEWDRMRVLLKLKQEEVSDKQAKLAMLATYVETEDGVFSFPDGDSINTALRAPAQELLPLLIDCRRFVGNNMDRSNTDDVAGRLDLAITELAAAPPAQEQPDTREIGGIPDRGFDQPT